MRKSHCSLKMWVSVTNEGPDCKKSTMRTRVRETTVSISILCAFVLVAWGTAPVIDAYNLSTQRRTFLKQGAASLLAASSGGAIANPRKAQAVTVDEDQIEVYFGCGCFWHVQHEFVQAERRILNRSDLELTSRTGYAGGKDNNKVCYHNALLAPDYGSLGHAEVVRLKIPPSSFEDFAREYIKLFDEKGYRPDQFLDKGREYRNVVGLPRNGPYAQQLAGVAKEMGVPMEFPTGTGGDGDARAVSYVMDTAKYPFYVAEQYHQFHNGFFLNEIYSPSYNLLANRLANKKLLERSRCPNGLVGLGVLGF